VFARAAALIFSSILLLCGQAAFSAAETDPHGFQVRFLKDGARVVLSRDGRVIAAAQVRPRTQGGPRPVLAGDAWRQEKVLAEGAEALHPVSASGAQGQSPVSVLIRAQRMASGVRLLVSPAGGGVAAPGLEMAVQIFSHGKDAAPQLMAVDAPMPGVPTPHLPPADGTPFRALRLTFRSKDGQRVELARSGPADWSMQKSQTVTR